MGLLRRGREDAYTLKVFENLETTELRGTDEGIAFGLYRIFDWSPQQIAEVMGISDDVALKLAAEGTRKFIEEMARNKNLT